MVVLLLSATHFRKSGHARLITAGGVSHFHSVFGQAFSLLSPRSLLLAAFPPLFGKFQHGAFASKLRAQKKRLHCRLKTRGRNSGLKRLSTVSTGSSPIPSLSSRFFHPFPKLGYQT